MGAGIGSELVQWGRRIIDSGRAWTRSKIEHSRARWKGGADPIELGEHYRRAHFSLMWIGTIVWIIALANPNLTGEPISGVSIPGIDIAIPWTVASVCLLLASLYFYLQYRHELEIEIIKASQTWKALDSQSIPAVTEVERRRVDELRDLTDQVSSAVGALKDELERYEHFDTQAMKLNKQQREKLVEIARFVNEARESFNYDRPPLNASQKAALLENLLGNIHVDHEYLSISQSQSDLKIQEAVEHWSHLTAALANFSNASDRISDIGRNFEKHMSDLRRTSDTISGKSRRKFFLLDRVGPVVFVSLGCVVMSTRWLFGVDGQHILDVVRVWWWLASGGLY